MKKQIANTISLGLLASFLAGTVFMIVFLIVIDMQTSHYYENGTPKMNCFGGLQYGIAIGIQILLLIFNLPVFFLLNQVIRKNKYFVFLLYFAGYFIYLAMILFSLQEFSSEEYFIIIPWINLLVWTFYYLKLKKIIKTENI